MDRNFARTDQPTLIRDLRNQAVLQTDQKVLDRHKKVMFDKVKQDKIEKEMMELKSEISEIKQLLKELIK